MRRWQWEIRRSADYAETIRHYVEDWDESGDREVYPPIRRISLREQFDMVLWDNYCDDTSWGRQDRRSWRWVAWRYVRSALGVLIARWEYWREPEWLKDPTTVLYFKGEGDA